MAANGPEKSGQNPNSGHLAEMARISPEFQAQAQKNIKVTVRAILALELLQH
jgi:hypothetical protein